MPARWPARWSRNWCCPPICPAWRCSRRSAAPPHRSTCSSSRSVRFMVCWRHTTSILPSRESENHTMLKAGDLIQLTDPKGRKHLLTLREGATFHTHRGALNHDDIIGGPDGNVVKSGGGTPYVVFRPLLADFTLAMKRGAAVVYPKDAAQIVAFADVFPGARVLEAGAGSGAMSCWLLRAVGEAGLVVSSERRADFADIARKNVERFFGGPQPSWRLHVGDIADAAADGEVFHPVVL